MVSRVLLLLASITFSASLLSQNTAKDFFLPGTKVTWYGFDFSHSKFIGAMSNGAQQNFTSPSEYKNIVIPQLNGLVLKEQRKYDLGRIFIKSQVSIDTSLVGAFNRKIDEKNIQTYDNIDFRFDTSAVAEYFEKYSFPSSASGIGILVFVEQANKIKNQAAFYFTVFDISTKKILFIEHMEGRMLGGGFRNYYAGAIHYVFDEIERTFYEKWKKRHGKS